MLPPLTYKAQVFLSEIQTDRIEVLKILNSLNVAKATGPDNIGNRLLKCCANQIVDPLVFLFNKSLMMVYFQINGRLLMSYLFSRKMTDKIVKIIVLFHYCLVCQKSWKKLCLTGCTTIGKLIICYQYVIRVSRKNDGTVNRLLYLVDRIHRGFDDTNEIAMVFLDITKAFDRVWHKGLIHKLQNFGVNEKLLNWFKCYLTGRSQRVVLDGFRSSIRDLFAGVPEESILGPLLFLIFIHDIEDNIISDISLFADDTALLQKYKNVLDVENILNNDLKTIDCWSKSWMVDFNPRRQY